MDESPAWGAATLCYLMLARNSPAPPPSSPTPRKCCQAEANTLLFLLRGPESTWAWTSLLTPWMPGVGRAARALEAPWLRDIHAPPPAALIQPVFPASSLSQALRREESDLAPALREISVSLVAGVGVEGGEIRQEDITDTRSGLLSHLCHSQAR